MKTNKIALVVGIVGTILTGGILVVADMNSNYKVKMTQQGNHIRVEETWGRIFKTEKIAERNIQQPDDVVNPEEPVLDINKIGSKVTKDGVTIKVLPNDYEKIPDSKTKLKSINAGDVD